MKNSYRLPLLAATSLVATLASQGVAHGQAFYLQEQSARGAGRAFSGEAADTGAASLWWNPAASAGMTEAEVAVSASLILPKGEVVDTGTQIVRPGQAPAGVGGIGYSNNPIEDGLLPSGSIAFPLSDRLSVGLTLASPYSFTTDYSDTSWVRYTADRTRLRTYDVQPSIAFAPAPWLRLGAALNAQYAKATFSNKLPQLAPGLPDGDQSLSGDGWDFGWSVGAQIVGGPVTFGASYKSKIDHTLTGEISTSGLLGPLAGQNGTVSDVSAKFTTPWQAIGSVRVAATDRLTLNGQVIRYGWSDFDAIRLGSPVNSAIPENYADSWSYAGGFDYVASDDITLRAGVQRATTPTQDGFRDARVPDADRWNYGVGTTIRVSDSFSLDAAANYVSFDNASIDRTTAAYAGTAAQTPILVSGELRDANAVVLSMGGRFRF